MEEKQRELEDMANLHGVDVLGKVGNAVTRIEVRCRSCKNQWSDRFAVFRAGNWCKKCKPSFDRTVVEAALQKYDPVHFQPHPRLEEAPDVNFDYYIEHDDIAIYVDVLHADPKILREKARVVSDIGMKYLHIHPNLILKPDELDKLILRALYSQQAFISSDDKIIGEVIAPAPAPIEPQDMHRFQFSGVLALMPYGQAIQLMLNRGELKQLGDSSYMTQELMSPSPETPSYLIYCRLSTMFQVVDGFSLADQLNRACDAIRLDRGHIRAAYYDLGLTGTNTDRPGLMAAIEHIKPGERLVVATLSRFARNSKDAVVMNDLLKTKRAKLKILDYNIDTSTPLGEMIFIILAALASFESQQTAQRTSSVMQKMAADDNLVTKPRFGWKIPDKKKKGLPHVKDERQQATIEYIRELRNSKPLMSLRSICELLDSSDAHRRDPKDLGKKWNPTSLRRVMIANSIPIHPGDKTDIKDPEEDSD